MKTIQAPLRSLTAAMLTMGVGLGIAAAQERREDPRPPRPAPGREVDRPDRPNQPARPDGDRPGARPSGDRPDVRPGGPNGERPFNGQFLDEKSQRILMEAMSEHREALMELGQKMMESRRSLNAVIYDEKASEETIREKMAAVAKIETEMVLLRKKSFEKVRKDLSKDAIEMLKNMPGGPMGFGQFGGGGRGGVEPSRRPDGQVGPRGGDQPRRPDGEARPRDGGDQPRKPDGEVRPRGGDQPRREVDPVPPKRRPDSENRDEPRKPDSRPPQRERE